MKSEFIDLLVEVASKKSRTTTSELAKKLGTSQQTISRKTRDLEKHGFIERKNVRRGQIISLTESGRALIRKKYLELQAILEHSSGDSVSFGGHVVSGSGEGKYYIGLDDYFFQFQEKLGFRPFLGTLNIRLKSVHDIRSKSEMEKMKPVVIKGFEKDGRTFGEIRCYPCMANRKTRCVVIIPERTHHPHDIVEIIAPSDMRKELGLREGDYVHVEMKS